MGSALLGNNIFSIPHRAPTPWKIFSFSSPRFAEATFHEHPRLFAHEDRIGSWRLLDICGELILGASECRHFQSGFRAKLWDRSDSNG